MTSLIQNIKMEVKYLIKSMQVHQNGSMKTRFLELMLKMVNAVQDQLMVKI